VDELTRLIDEIIAASTREEARAIFESHDIIFLGMRAELRECAYAAIEDLLAQKS
jgi:hypothetical protein